MGIYGKKKEIRIMNNGKIIKPKDGEYIILKAGHILGVIGKEINKMDLV